MIGFQRSTIYKNSALAAVDYFDDSLRFSMDLDLWLRLLKIGSCVNVGGPPIAGYREWDGTKTSTGDAKLLRERKAMLLRHGAAPTDNTIRAIDVALMKSAIKSIPIVGGVVKAMEGIFKMTLLFSYYGFAAHLPASSTRYTRWCRTFRRAIVSRLLGQAGNNINVEKGAQFGTGAKISLGTNSGIGVNCKLMGKVTIGNNVMMGPEVVFITTTHEHSRTDIPMFKQGSTQEQPIHVGDDVWIGMRCTILPGVRIGNGVIVGAGSVVTKNVPDYVVVAGNPARVIRNRATQRDELTHD
jgi:maltose O-acetyltransferase